MSMSPPVGFSPSPSGSFSGKYVKVSLSSSSMIVTSFGTHGVSSFFIHPSSRRIVVEIAP